MSGIEKEETIESQVKTVERHDPLIMDGLKKAPIYRKQGEVKASMAVGGEEVVTRLADGSIETTNTANPGDAIITNPGGEQYIIGATKFGQRYEPKVGEDGVYLAKGHCRAIPNPWNMPITMMASWGQMQEGQASCMMADTYDLETDTLGGEPYIIAGAEFTQTYKAVEQQSTV